MEKPTIVTLKKGDVLREQGDYIVLSGYLICRLSRQLINFMSTGDFIATDNSIFRYEARSQVQLMLIQNDGIGSVQGRRELVLQERMLAVVRRMDGFLESLERRLIILLHQAGEEIGTVTKDNTCEIPSILTHQEIAQYLGCTREYLCGMRKKK
ncbi:hypothetical protein PWEIH_09793 [Listeria weihenstephanensis FSL R9-0317]|uniref:Crp/Fnr family transcriptional regulator n=1 Tax=Listeria weihenstephanensis TaxID=1006155 RepID=UPI0003E8BBF1|nr:Crp/Fnr family transcriptional regulator [Listeria weihenstephanensis]EUJ38280.1 hypothetical protein PWEIH_09793 [Listeria weihenstephanensis FSL R9-0317]